MAATASAGSVVIDLEALTFCDSSGVAMFIAAQTNATARSTALAIRNLRPPVRRVFEIAADTTAELSYLNSAEVMKTTERVMATGTSWEFPAASVSALELDLSPASA